MLNRVAVKSEHTLYTRPWNQSPKTINPFPITSQPRLKQSYQSSQHSDRPTSTRRIFIPKNQQLNQFFQHSRHKSTQRSMPLPLESSQYSNRLNLNVFSHRTKHEESAQRRQFLREGLNADYFNDVVDKNPKFMSNKQKEMFSRSPLLQSRQSPKSMQFKVPNTHLQQVRDQLKNKHNRPHQIHSYKHIPLKKNTDQNTIAAGKVITSQRSVHGRSSSAKLFEYTFGLH